MKATSFSLAILVCAAVAASSAGQTPAFSFSTPATIMGARDTNINVGPGRISDDVVLFSPGTMALARSDARLDFSMHYMPEFQLFKRYSDLNQWNHAADLHFGYKLTPRLTFTTGDAFTWTGDPGRQLSDRQLLLPLGRYEENSAYADLSYLLTPRTTVALRYDNTISSFAPRDSTGINLFNQMSNGGTFSLTRDLTSRQKLGASYSYVEFQPRGAAATTGGNPALLSGHVHDFMLSDTLTLNQGLILELGGGSILTRGSASYLLSGRVEEHWSRLSISTGYFRSLSLLAAPTLGGVPAAAGLGPVAGPVAAPGLRTANGLLPGMVYEAVSLRVNAKLTSRAGLEFTSTAARTTGVAAADRLKSVVGDAKFRYRVAERVSLFCGTDIQNQTVNTFVGLPLARRSYFAGVEVAISSPQHTPQQRTQAGPAPLGGDR